MNVQTIDRYLGPTAVVITGVLFLVANFVNGGESKRHFTLPVEDQTNHYYPPDPRPAPPYNVYARVGDVLTVKNTMTLPCTVKTGDVCYYTIYGNAQGRVISVTSESATVKILKGGFAHYAGSTFAVDTMTWSNETMMHNCNVVIHKANANAK